MAPRGVKCTGLRRMPRGVSRAQMCVFVIAPDALNRGSSPLRSRLPTPGVHSLLARIHAFLRWTTMPRTRTAGTGPRRRESSLGPGTLTQTAERMIGQIEDLVGEIAALRADNDALRNELRDAVEMLQRA